MHAPSNPASRTNRSYPAASQILAPARLKRALMTPPLPLNLAPSISTLPQISEDSAHHIAMALQFAKQCQNSAVSLPLPMHGLTLCGFERSTRPSSIAINPTAQSSPVSPCDNHFSPLLATGKRSRDHDCVDNECRNTMRDSLSPSDRPPSQLQGPSSDGEGKNTSGCNGRERNRSQIILLQHENADLQKKIQASDEELQKLRLVVNQLFDVEKTQKRSGKEDTKPQRRYWNNDEHERFLQALQRHGPKDVKAISNFVGTRNPTQVRTHAQKYFQKLARMSGSSMPGESCSGDDNSSSPGSPSDKHM